MQRLIAIILFIISFFVPGDMSKGDVYPEKAIDAGATKAEFVFENKTGNRLEITVKIDSIERKAIENDGEWVAVPFEQYFNEGVTQYKLYPNEKTTLHVDFVNADHEDVPLISGDYRIKVTYKMSGYTDNTTGSVTKNFSVSAFDW